MLPSELTRRYRVAPITLLSLSLLFLRVPARAEQPAQEPRGAASGAEDVAKDKERDLTWTAHSSNGNTTLAQTSLGPGQGCRATCKSGLKEMWSVKLCIGRTLDLRFVSGDCERAVIFHPIPQGTRRWQASELAHVLKNGKPDYTVQAGGLFRDEAALKRNGSTYYWLAGALDQPGTPPHYTADGKGVAYGTLDGKSYVMPLVRQP